MAGGDGNDILTAIAYGETIDGGAGDDTIISGFESSFLFTGHRADSYLGGAGNDWLSYARLTASTNNTVTVDLVTGRSSGIMGNDVFSGIENVLAGAGNDSILGDDSANFLIGGAGNDTLMAGAGNDTLMGGNGADNLSGGAGDDVILIGNTTLADIMALFAS